MFSTNNLSWDCHLTIHTRILDFQTLSDYRVVCFLREILISSCSICKFDRWMPEIQAFCLYLICLTSQQEMLLIGHTPQSILLCTQMVPKRSGHSLPEIHRLSSKNSFWNLPWIPGLHLLSLLTTKSMNIDLEVEVHPTYHPVWILTSPEASTSSHPVLSNKKVILLGKDAGERWKSITCFYCLLI